MDERPKETIKTLRDKIDVSQETLANALGLSRQTIAKYDKSESPPLWILYSLRWLVHCQKMARPKS